MRLLSLILVVFVSSVGADEPPSWREFITTSESGEYSATVTKQTSDWILSVYVGRLGSFPDPTVLPIWSTAYDYDGYSSGLLSNDGRVFVYLNAWFYPRKPVLTIIREDCTIRYPGNHFVEEEAHLRNSSSHKLWLESQYPTLSNIGGDLAVIISTYAGIKRVSSECN